MLVPFPLRLALFGTNVLRKRWLFVFVGLPAPVLLNHAPFELLYQGSTCYSFDFAQQDVRTCRQLSCVGRVGESLVDLENLAGNTIPVRSLNINIKRCYRPAWYVFILQ